MANERMTVNGIELEVLRRGLPGTPLSAVARHGHGASAGPFLDLLGRHAEIIAPSSPGFGNTPRPADFDTIYDLVHLYLALIDELPYDKVALLGLSFGGWLAAEIAAPAAISSAKLILVDPVGIKIGDRESRDILDVFNVNPAEVRALQLARSGERARLRRDERRGTGHPCAQLGGAVPLCLAPLHVQPAAEAMARPHPGADPAAVGRQRPGGHPRLRPRLCRADPGRAVRD